MDDAAVNTAEFVAVAVTDIDEDAGVAAIAIYELGAAFVRCVRDFQDGSAHGDAGSGRQIVWRQVHVDEQVIASWAQLSLSPAIRSMQREFIVQICTSGCGSPASVDFQQPCAQ